LRRRAGAPRLIDWTGERCVPWTPDVQVVYEHMHRYLWAATVVAGRRVLDLGSGEGFGASILSSGEETEVVGIDIHERTVEHAELNWAGPRTSFKVGNALDLSEFEDGSFGAVVAFEVIEHVDEQERVLAEVARVLADDGVLIISTPDRRLYSDATGQVNPFHQHELTYEEFSALLEGPFPHVAVWGQRTITGSHLAALGSPAEELSATEFFIERAGDEWRLASEPAALYLVALASRAELPDVSSSSVLGDCDLELVRAAERDAADTAKAVAVERDEGQERERIARITMERERSEVTAERSEVAAERRRTEFEREQNNVALAQRDEYVRHRQAEIDVLRARLDHTTSELADLGESLEQAQRFNRRVEESVTWQTFQRVRGRVFSSIGGETSLFARALRFSLRLAGRVMSRRPVPPPLTQVQEQEALDALAQSIELPTFDQPRVSLVIPLFAAADLTRRCLETIRDNTMAIGYEVILVDDTADAETKRLLEQVHGARVLVNEQNEGYLRSVNRGAALARGEWIVLCNNDIEVQLGWLEAMLDCAESDESVGVVAPKFVSPDGLLSEAGGIIWSDGTGANYGRGDDPGLFQYEYRREIDYGSAAALMVRAELWREIGGFDERYLPMYYEDTDLCFEVRERGWRVLYEPRAVVMHVEGGTAGTDPDEGHKRHQEANRPKFVEKWRRRLESGQMRPAPTKVRMAANRHRGPQVLVVDHRVPTWDRDSGSLRMMNIMRTMLDLGARVSFMPDNFSPLQPYTRLLQRMGIEVFYGQLDVNAELATIGPRLSTVILSRPHAASRWLDVLREFAPAATIVYDTVDLHWLREARRVGRDTSAAALGNGHRSLDELPPKAQALRYLELAMVRAADISLTVTEDERAQIEYDVPGADVRVVPNVHDVQSLVSPPEGRTGILFVGGFEHPPNVDAALHLVKDVMPEVWRELGDVRVSIVGAEAPAEVRALASPLVDVLGWVEDLQPLLDGSRLMLAPLRYGAGMKGKVTQCLAAGLPVVTTSVGAEGLLRGVDGDESSEEEALLIADAPRDLAAHAIRLYRDPDLWRRLSGSGQRLIGEICSTEVVSRQLGELLGVTPSSVANGARQRD
jgi:GT2 family glycosyltransferase/SAM-dependent methyltransferase/glycosyltransferase involved in cell wall biosynthesis